MATSKSLVRGGGGPSVRFTPIMDLAIDTEWESPAGGRRRGNSSPETLRHVDCSVEAPLKATTAGEGIRT